LSSGFSRVPAQICLTPYLGGVLRAVVGMEESPIVGPPPLTSKPGSGLWRGRGRNQSRGSWPGCGRGGTAFRSPEEAYAHFLGVPSRGRGRIHTGRVLAYLQSRRPPRTRWCGREGRCGPFLSYLGPGFDRLWRGRFSSSSRAAGHGRKGRTDLPGNCRPGRHGGDSAFRGPFPKTGFCSSRETGAWSRP